MSDTLFWLPPGADSHFRLYFYAALVRLLENLGPAAERFPFLEAYSEELASHGPLAEHAEPWRTAIRAWEDRSQGHLPLRALRETAGLDHDSIVLLMVIALPDEDSRFGGLFETLTGESRPTAGFLGAWFRDSARLHLRALLDAGLVQVANPEAARVARMLQTPAALWDALHDDPPSEIAPWATVRPANGEEPPEGVAALVENGSAQAVIVRGPARSGRRALLGSLGRKLLEVRGLGRSDDPRWRIVGPLATALDAMPVVVLDLAPSETAEIPRLVSCAPPLGVVMGRYGGVSGPGVEGAVVLETGIPEPSARRAIWADAIGESADVERIAETYRLTSGNIRRCARMAWAQAALAGHGEVRIADVRAAGRALNREALDTLAVHVEADGDWGQLSAPEDVRRELDALAARCRLRERLRERVGPALRGRLNPGVRALFTGPSGTGKTLAARLLAAAIEKDLYRLDLSTILSKYIGETEKNLHQVFSRAEELDVVLLLDEGDSLLAQRTSVQTSNDRYANLETNFLLQRIEEFEGILLVTTNAAEQIDQAFQRRMDVVVKFRAPDAAERFVIWQLHLPPDHAVDPGLLRDAAMRCSMTGGQIRNAALHAALLATRREAAIGDADVSTAIVREYRKTGSACPLGGA